LEENNKEFQSWQECAQYLRKTISFIYYILQQIQNSKERFITGITDDNRHGIALKNKKLSYHATNQATRLEVS